MRYCIWSQSKRRIFFQRFCQIMSAHKLIQRLIQFNLICSNFVITAFFIFTRSTTFNCFYNWLFFITIKTRFLIIRFAILARSSSRSSEIMSIVRLRDLTMCELMKYSLTRFRFDWNLRRRSNWNLTNDVWLQLSTSFIAINCIDHCTDSNQKFIE